MSSSTSAPQIEGLQCPPLRSLDDFLLGSARFQLPNLKDFDKWGNRVVKNLLYYQTNYFVLFAVIYTLMVVLNPAKIIAGILVKTLLVGIFVQLFTDKGVQSTRRMGGDGIHQQRWMVLGGTVFASYLLLYWFDAVLMTLFTLLLPFCASFVHASLRLRNIRNKVANTIESFGPATPMGIFLNAMNITVENILS